MDKQNYYLVNQQQISLKYSELKKLRDDGQLIPGYHYRITDYVTTTVQAQTKSAGNVFDVIVLAVSENELSHTARAIQHEGDTYFDGNDLGAWELWYDLDNDTEKYEWADATNGKGVIYRMIDDKRNDCPYDFKNILFYNDKYTNSTTTDKYYYTFSYVVNRTLYDGTVEKRVNYCYGNSIGEYIYSEKKSLNRNVFRCKDFGKRCHSNILGDNCQFNTFGDSCYHNIFGDNCQINTFDDGCYSNTFGNHCSDNTFSYNCSNNTFSNICTNNTFANNCGYNIFSYYCRHNTFGESCSYNTFDNNCQRNTFGYDCDHNTFGASCNNNSFDNNCECNALGNYCIYNTFGNKCSYKHLDHEKTSITLNEEYYDDGSGQLVPVKHPDLSTQPSILPYKFMGQYVYEQLIPMDKEWLEHLVADSPKRLAISKLGLSVQQPIFLEAQIVAWDYGYMGARLPLLFPVYLSEATSNDSTLFDIVARYNAPKRSNDVMRIGEGYIRIVYTSMPEEGEDYYNYSYSSGPVYTVPTFAQDGIYVEYIGTTANIIYVESTNGDPTFSIPLHKTSINGLDWYQALNAEITAKIESIKKYDISLLINLKTPFGVKTCDVIIDSVLYKSADITIDSNNYKTILMDTTMRDAFLNGCVMMFNNFR